MGESIRAFVALSLPDEAVKAVERTVDEIRALAEQQGVRGSWTRHPHLTLVFLGQTLLTDMDRVSEPLRKACEGIGPIQISIEKIGGFPSLSRPKVVWLGLAGEVDKLVTLQKQVAEAVKGIGQHRETKRFSPHITVGRLRESPPRSFTAALKQLEDTKLVSARFNEVHLFRSELSPKGATYTPLHTIRLGETT